MRAITRDAVNAFKLGYTFNRDNTTVHTTHKGELLYLFGNMIAHKEGNELFITTCGYKTNTTKERLNGLLEVYNLPKIRSVKGVWFIGNEEWTEQRKIFKLQLKKLKIHNHRNKQEIETLYQ